MKWKRWWTRIPDAAKVMAAAIEPDADHVKGTLIGTYWGPLPDMCMMVMAATPDTIAMYSSPYWKEKYGPSHLRITVAYLDGRMTEEEVVVFEACFLKLTDVQLATAVRAWKDES